MLYLLQAANNISYSVEQVLIFFLTLLLAVVSFFLVRFHNQVDKLVADVGEMKEKQAANAVKFEAIQNRMEVFETHLLKNYQPIK
jgi:hypothetical protein